MSGAIVSSGSSKILYEQTPRSRIAAERCIFFFSMFSYSVQVWESIHCADSAMLEFLMIKCLSQGRLARLSFSLRAIVASGKIRAMLTSKDTTVSLILSAIKGSTLKAH